jgi:hypothetical protein
VFAINKLLKALLEEGEIKDLADRLDINDPELL